MCRKGQIFFLLWNSLNICKKYYTRKNYCLPCVANQYHSNGSFDSHSLSIIILSVGIELMIVRLCWLANSGISICRNPKQNVACECILTLAVSSMLCSFWMVCEKGDLSYFLGCSFQDFYKTVCIFCASPFCFFSNYTLYWQDYSLEGVKIAFITKSGFRELQLNL